MFLIVLLAFSLVFFYSTWIINNANYERIWIVNSYSYKTIREQNNIDNNKPFYVKNIHSFYIDKNMFLSANNIEIKIYSKKTDNEIYLTNFINEETPFITTDYVKENLDTYSYIIDNRATENISKFFIVPVKNQKYDGTYYVTIEVPDLSDDEKIIINSKYPIDIELDNLKYKKDNNLRWIILNNNIVSNKLN